MITRAVVHANPAEFLQKAGEYLRSTVLENNVAVGIAYRAVRQPERYPNGVWGATLEEDGVVAGIALQTPPWPLIVSRMSDAGLDALIGALGGLEVSSVVGPTEPVGELSRRIGATVSHRQEQRLYALREKPAPPSVAGRMRAMGLADRPTALEWIGAFDREIGEPRTAEERGRAFDLGLSTGQFFLWEDGLPVSMAIRVETPPDGCRIGGVYTPPDRRRRGYAGAVVAALSRRSLDEGRAWCRLYTDLSNPTSNAIYQRIGYRPLLDVVKAIFERPLRL